MRRRHDIQPAEPRCRTAAVVTAEARLRALVDAHLDTVWRALKRLGVPEAGADDATQEVFIVAARRLDEIDHGRERGYLLGIALRVAADARRALRRRGEVPLDEVGDGALAGTGQHVAGAAEAALDQQRARLGAGGGARGHAGRAARGVRVVRRSRS